MGLFAPFFIMVSFSYKELFHAYDDCIRKKKNSPNAVKYMQNYIENTIKLCDEINNGTYEIGKSICFIIKYPKYREVFAADFRDRVVHHLVIMELMPYFENYFIKESFSCMVGRGTLCGIKTMADYMDKASKHYNEECYCLKMDVKNFFMNINKTLLTQMLDDFIVKFYPDNRKKKCLRHLCKLIILHHPEKDCIVKSPKEMWDILGKSKSLFTTEENKGLAIGNLTSQLFANFYMTILDLYIKKTLGFDYYGRYVDDIILIHKNKEKLKLAIKQIRKFCKEELLIEMSEKKVYLQEVKHGVAFLGGVIKPNRIYCGNRTIKQIYYKLENEYRKLNINRFLSSINSYFGILGHYSTYRIKKKIIDHTVFKEWLKHVEVDDNLSKVKLSTKYLVNQNKCCTFAQK